MASVVILNSDEDVLERMADALMGEGHETTARLIGPATTASELARFIATHTPHVVVYDLRPAVDECLRVFCDLYAHPDLPEVPFVLTTPVWPQLPALRHSDAVVAMVRDPISFDEVISAVKQACSRHA
jgi:hypothetical protein